MNFFLYQVYFLKDVSNYHLRNAILKSLFKIEFERRIKSNLIYWKENQKNQLKGLVQEQIGLGYTRLLSNLPATPAIIRGFLPFV